MNDLQHADSAHAPQLLMGQLSQSREGAAILATLDSLDRLIAAAAPRVAPERTDRAIHGVVAQLAQVRPRAALAEMLSRWFAPATALAGALAVGALLALVEPIIVNQQGDDLSSVLTMIFDVNTTDQGPFAL